MEERKESVLVWLSVEEVTKVPSKQELCTNWFTELQKKQLDINYSVVSVLEPLMELVSVSTQLEEKMTVPTGLWACGDQSTPTTSIRTGDGEVW